MLISEFLVLGPSGRRLLHKKYRHDVPAGALENYCLELTEDKPDLKATSRKDGVFFAHIRRDELYFIAASVHETPSVCVLEFLTRLYHVLKDFCGVLNEESIEDNIVLLYEVLDEIMDYGYIQLAATGKIKPFIHSDPIMHRSQEIRQHGLFGIEQHVIPGSAESRTVIDNKTQQELRKSEVYVDVVEKISAVVAANGVCERCDVEGQLLMKSFSTSNSAGATAVHVALNEDLVIDAQSLRGYGEMARLAECSFHGCVDEHQQQHPQTLHLGGGGSGGGVRGIPEGQFCVMSYRLGGDLPHGLPLRLHTRINMAEPAGASGCELRLCLQCPVATAVNVSLSIPVPHSTISVQYHVNGEEGEQMDYMRAQQTVYWSIKKLQKETIAVIKLQCEGPVDIHQLGPVHMDFELSNFVCSNLKIRSVKMVDPLGASTIPNSWIRYVTTRDSYVYKLA